MHIKWIQFLKSVSDAIKKMEKCDTDIPCFRGQADSKWDLLPSLFIKAQKKGLKAKEDIWRLEYNLYFDFVTNSGNLLDKRSSSWEILFEMRHHGIPTRILDWSENFGTALFFALNGGGDSPTIWILDPYILNSKTKDIGYFIPNPLVDLDFDYRQGYLTEESKTNPYRNPVAIIPPRTSSRIFAQKGLFTLHGTDSTPINKKNALAPCIQKFVLPKEAYKDAENFLTLAGINEYSIYPDLDGLSKYLNRFHKVQ